METTLRRSGVEILGDVSWGTHFCQFFKTGEDLTGLLVPYFKAGLESQEYCMWVVSAPLSVEDALEAMRKAVPDIDGYIRKGQMEIIPYTDWYMKGGSFDLQRVLNGWVERLEAALAKGYEGLRLTGNSTWLEKKDWRSFEEYEAAVNEVIGGYRMIAICTYSLDRCTAEDVLDVVRNHQFALMRRGGGWEVIRSGLKTEKAVSLLAAIVESSDDAIISKTPEGVILSWNKGAEKVYGYTAMEIVGKPIFVLVPPERTEEVRGILERVQRGERVSSYETTRIRKDGSAIQVSITISPVKDSEGRIIGASTIARDITLQKQTEEALRRAGAYNRSLIEASLDPLVTIGPDGKITDVNAATEMATGRSRGELIGTDFADYFAEPEKAREGYQQAFREGAVRDYALEIRHRDGRLTPVLYNASVYRDEGGEVIGLFAAARDITLQKQTLEQLREQQKAFLEVSVPVVSIWKRIILVPLIGMFDSRRAQLLMETLLSAIESSQAKVAILDISGIPIMDTQVAKHLIRTASAARLMGTECIITGIRASISQTIVHLGVDLAGVLTKTTLDEGIRLAFDLTRMKVVAQ